MINRRDCKTRLERRLYTMLLKERRRAEKSDRILKRIARNMLERPFILKEIESCKYCWDIQLNKFAKGGIRDG